MNKGLIKDYIKYREHFDPLFNKLKIFLSENDELLVAITTWYSLIERHCDINIYQQKVVSDYINGSNKIKNVDELITYLEDTQKYNMSCHPEFGWIKTMNV